MPIPSVIFTVVPRTVKQRVLPFVVIGQTRSGVSVIQTALSSHSACHCHSDLLDPSDKLRRKAHEDYFGPEADPDVWPSYCAQVQPDRARGNPERYLSSRIFPAALKGERAIGVKLLYSHIWYSGLWEYLRAKVVAGNFGIIHVIRSPLACFVSEKQAAQSKIRTWYEGDPKPRFQPSPVHVDPAEFIRFAQRHEADIQRVRNLSSAALTVQYRDICCHLSDVLSRTFRYLALPPCPASRPLTCRLPNRTLRGRIANFDEARRSVPRSLAKYFETDMI